MKNTICGLSQDAVTGIRKVVKEDYKTKTIKPDRTDPGNSSLDRLESPMNSTEFWIPALYGALIRETPAIDIDNGTFHSKLKKTVRLGILTKTEGDPGQAEPFYIPGEKYSQLPAD